MRCAAHDPTITDEIDERDVDAGVKLARWFAYEVERVYRILGEAGESSKDQKLLDFIQRGGGKVSVRDVQTGCRWIQTSEEARCGLQMLVDSGFGRWENPCPGPKGGRPKEVFRLASPGLVNETPGPESDSHGIADADTADGLDSEGEVSSA